MTEVILGIQIGTRQVRVKAYDLVGNQTAAGAEAIKIYHPASQHYELNADEMWDSCCAAVRHCLQQLARVHIISVGITSVGESLVLLDKKGRPADRTMTWYDQRATRQADALYQQFGMREIYRTTGQFISPKFGICKIMWVRDNAPEVFSNISKLLTLHDYIIYHLTGQIVTEYSLASRTMCFNVEKLQWADELIRFAGFSPDNVPTALPGGSFAGRVTAEAARQTGLAAGTPVFTGGHDHACAGVAVNIFDENVMMDSMGSAETTMAATAQRLDIDQGFRNQIAVYPHFGSKIFRAVTSIQAFGAVFDWLGGWLAQDGGEGEAFVKRYLQGMDSRELSESALLFIPHLRGLQESADARGAFLGIDETSNCQNMMHAVVEGLCFELRRRASACEKAFGRTFSAIRAVGEYSSIPALMQMKAMIAGNKIETIHYEDAVTYGAALVGALGAGIISETDLKDVFRTNAEYVPEYKSVQSYYPRYERYLALHRYLLEMRLFPETLGAENRNI